tara:strand:- start:617 stop:1300 length:684 start_codon:yes stop_codon:yes gene_type:complete
MMLGGLIKFTTIDYPGQIACTVFTSGCNYRCPYCHNPELVEAGAKHSEEDFFSFIKTRMGTLDGVCICGGEPTIHQDLPEFIKKIKDMGFLVKLDTNGSNPEMLASLIKDKLIDYVALDIKAPKDRYNEAIGMNINVENIERCISILEASDIEYEFRTTVVPSLINKEDIISIARWLGKRGKFYLQNFKPARTLDPNFNDVLPYSNRQLDEFKSEIRHLVSSCGVRK